MAETDGWDDYWTGSRSGVAFGSEGADHPALESFWRGRFAGIESQWKMLDVASGRGALLDQLAASGGDLSQMVALDFSGAALESLRERHPQVQTVVADASAVPFLDSSFELIVSQFGVEYGGSTAIDGLPGLLSPRGQLWLVMHSRGSVIFNECRDNLDALEELERSRFLPFAEAMFQAGYDVVRGQIGRKEAAAAARRVLEPFHGLAAIMDQYGEQVAGGTIQTLYRETARIQERFQYHLEDEVLNWLRTMTVEVKRYQDRMRSMLQSSRTKEDVDHHLRQWKAEGLSVDRAEQIKDESGQVLGWTICGIKDD